MEKSTAEGGKTYEKKMPRIGKEAEKERKESKKGEKRKWKKREKEVEKENSKRENGKYSQTELMYKELFPA